MELLLERSPTESMNVPKKKRLKYKKLVKFYYELRTNYRSLKKKIDQQS